MGKAHRHHVVYENPEKRQKEVIRHIRPGLHHAITLIRRFSYLTEEEVNCVVLEALLKQRFQTEGKLEGKEVGEGE